MQFYYFNTQFIQQEICFATEKQSQSCITMMQFYYFNTQFIQQEICFATENKVNPVLR
jgi:hypothetical protein